MFVKGVTLSIEVRKPKPLPSLAKDGSRHVTDDFYNALFSSIGALLFLVGTILLVHSSIVDQKPWHTVSFLIYGTSTVCLFAVSAIHHAVDGTPKTNLFLLRLDFCAIYLMIAGNATPFCLILIRNTFGWIILGLFWFLALAGIILAGFFPVLPRWVNICIYVGISWLGLLILYPIYQQIREGLVLMLLGGIFYTVGAVLYCLQLPNPKPGRFGFHEIWHLFVLAGALSHSALMWFYLR